jgi:hypothetical protein
MTPVRNAVIRPMLVERNTQSVGWTEVTAQELDSEKHAELFERLDMFKNNSNGNREYYPSYRLDRDGNRSVSICSMKVRISRIGPITH